MNMKGEEFYNLIRSKLPKGVLSSFLEAFEKKEKKLYPNLPFDRLWGSLFHQQDKIQNKKATLLDVMGINGQMMMFLNADIYFSLDIFSFGCYFYCVTQSDYLFDLIESLSLFLGLGSFMPFSQWWKKKPQKQQFPQPFQQPFS